MDSNKKIKEALGQDLSIDEIEEISFALNQLGELFINEYFKKKDKN